MNNITTYYTADRVLRGGTHLPVPASAIHRVGEDYTTIMVLSRDAEYIINRSNKMCKKLLYFTRYGHISAFPFKDINAYTVQEHEGFFSSSDYIRIDTSYMRQDTDIYCVPNMPEDARNR